MTEQLATTGYAGRKGPKMATRGGQRTAGRPLLCARCGAPLGRKGMAPAVKRPDGRLVHGRCP